MKGPHTWSLATEPLFGKLIWKSKNSIKVDLVEDFFSSWVGTVSRSVIWCICESALKIGDRRLFCLSIAVAMVISIKRKKRFLWCDINFFARGRVCMGFHKNGLWHNAATFCGMNVFLLNGLQPVTTRQLSNSNVLSPSVFNSQLLTYPLLCYLNWLVLKQSTL